MTGRAATALPPLATSADLAAYLGRTFTPEEQARADVLMAAASAAIRIYTSQTISLVADDVEVRDAPGGLLVQLNQAPIVGIASIVSAGVTIDPSSYVFKATTATVWWVATGDDLLFPAAWYGGWGWGRQRLAFTYTHGYDPVPADVQAICCAMADRVLNGPGGGLRSEQIGGYRYDLGPTAGLGAIGMTASEAATLDFYSLPFQVVA